MTSDRSETNRRNAQKPRIRPNLRVAIEIMTYLGLTRAEAAEEAGMSLSGLHGALRKGHVKALMNKCFRDMRAGKPMSAYTSIEALAKSARSEVVQLKANMWIAGVNGLAPVKASPRMTASGEASFAGYAYCRAIKDEVDPKPIDLPPRKSKPAKSR